MRKIKTILISIVVLVILFVFGGSDDLMTKIENIIGNSNQEVLSDLEGNSVHYSDLEYAEIKTDVDDQIKTYKGFVLSFNSENHTPNWVGWELLSSEIGGTIPRSDRFWTDDKITGCPAHSDYKRSGYDRGHMIPAADQKWDEDAMNDCFVMANMCPQDGSLNSGAWNTLEEKCRLWAQRDSALVIVAGPIYKASDRKTIGENKVRVPSAFYKVIVAPYLETPRGIGFVYPNMTAPGNMQNYVMTIDDIEELTGIDFFANLPDDIENEVESVSSFKEWNRR